MSETATVTLPHPMTRSAPLDVEALWRSAADDLYAYACTVLRDPAAAEDVVAVTFERRCGAGAGSTGGAATHAPGCSGSPATPRSTSCDGGGAARP